MTDINVIWLRSTAKALRDPMERQSVLNFPLTLAMSMEEAAKRIEELEARLLPKHDHQAELEQLEVEDMERSDG